MFNSEMRGETDMDTCCEIEWVGLYRGTEEVKAEAEGTGVCSVNSNKLEPLEPQISIAAVYTIRQRLSQYYIMIMVATIYYLACKVRKIIYIQ